MKKANYSDNKNTGLMQGGTLGKYVTGYVLSLLLTIAAYLLVVEHVDSGHRFVGHTAVIAIISGLAIAQFVVQVIYFLHLGKESNPQWNRLLLGFMALVILILFFGSLWIMANLDYHHAQQQDGQQLESYIIEREAIEPDH